MGVRRVPRFGAAVSVGGDVTPPAYNSGEIGDVDVFTVAVTFNEPMGGADFLSGVTIKVDSVAQTISAAVQQSAQLVYYTIPRAAQGSTITWEYLAASGSIQDTSGNLLGDVTAQTEVNNIARHLWWNDLADSGHLAHFFN